MHVGGMPGQDGLVNRRRSFPGIEKEPVGLRDIKLIENGLIGHWPPADGHIERNEPARRPPAVMLRMQHSRGNLIQGNRRELKPVHFPQARRCNGCLVWIPGDQNPRRMPQFRCRPKSKNDEKPEEKKKKFNQSPHSAIA